MIYNIVRWPKFFSVIVVLVVVVVVVVVIKTI